MSRKSVHVVRNAKGQWAVRSSGKVKAGSIHSTQKEAIEKAMSKAKREKTNLVVHKANGRIRDFRSYAD